MLCSKPGIKGKKKKQDVKYNGNSHLRMRMSRALKTTESKQDYNEKCKMRMRSSRDVQDDKTRLEKNDRNAISMRQRREK